MRFTVDRIDHIVLNVKDVEISVAWYLRVLGMEREEFGPENRTALKFGGQKINVRPADADPGRWVTGVNTGAGAGALGPIRSVYCRDPDGNQVEIASYLSG
jgi:catechol 2,3-dioxygenase-like lactoylglutathione lyase family enzyme